jgi:hypothetical protein
MKTKALNLMAAIAMLAVSSQALANIVGWTTVGNSGVSTSNDGAVTIPTGFSSVNWISTYGGVSGNNGGYGGTDGSTVTSNSFAVSSSGAALSFAFNFITSDGTTQFPDYAWANLYNAADSSLVATLFTATTNPSGSAVPGTGAGLPTISAAITPASVIVTSGAGSTDWSPLGSYSGQCWQGYGNGCGNTGWVSALYNIADAGSYYMVFGVANASDTIYDSGLAFVGTEIDGVPIGNSNGDVPEPGSVALLGLGLLGLLAAKRKKA